MFPLLISQRRLSFIGILLLTLLSAAIGIGILAYIRTAFLISNPNTSSQVLFLFLGLVLALMIVSALTQIFLHQLGHRFVMDLRQDWVSRLLKLDLEQMQRIGSGRILALLNTDIRNITIAFVHLPELIHSLLLVTGILFYLAYLSPALFAVIITTIMIIALLGLTLVGRLSHYISKVRRDEDLLQQDYQAMVSGKRELTLNQSRANAFFNHELSEHADSYRHNVTRADSMVDLSNSLANGLVLAMVGISFYVSSALGWADNDVAAIYALAILFLRTPMMTAVSAVPIIVSAQISYRNMQSLSLPEQAEALNSSAVSLFTTFKRITFSDVSYGYGETQQFDIGPINFKLNRGELVFIIGGNGSGKSTFANLLCGLYQPKSGEILIDGDILKAEQWNEYRQLFSAIFSDFHVFRQLIDGQGEDANQAEIDEWLKRLGMDDKVTTENNRLSAVDFSQGQKKRLALLMAVLEKRDCLLLDEWAADQDPQFRHFFYNQLLPLLAKQGKTIIAITHDDHYFDGADRILKMDEGRLLELTASERQALNKLAHSNNEITYLVAE